MSITEDKHVKFMFSKMQKWEQAADFKLYVTLEPRAKVGVEEEIVQTTTSLQGESSTVPIVEDEDEDCVGEDVDDRDEYEERIDNGDFDRGLDDHEIAPILHVDDMAECDEDDANTNVRVQHVTNTTPVYEPPTSSFYENTWENMVDFEVDQQAFGSSWNVDMNFAKELIFANKEAVKCALTIYAAKHNRNIITSRSTKSRLAVKCVDESCIWYVGAVEKPKYGLWMVTSYKGPHSCIPLATALDGRMMDCNFLAAEFVPLLQEKHTIFGDWEESYQRLRKLLLAYLDQEPGTRFWCHTIPRDEFGDTILRYVFWAFAPCIEGFIHCKPVINIDGTHLYGKYRGVLLIAMATDANNKVLPLAFAVVDKESGPSWRWFLERLRNALGDVIANKDICIISDRHKGIQNAIANWPRDDDG
nr:uncharacterized protein LOC112032347 [Quercus suber]